MVAFAKLSLRLFALFLASVAMPVLRADPPPASYTLTLPLQSNLSTPAWLSHPETPSGTFATLDLPLTPPQEGNALLVTFTFQEKEGGFLRLAWKNAAGEQELSANFFQGVGMQNQRSILIPANVVGNAGTLIVQCGDTTLDVQKIEMEWLENRNSLVSPEWPDQEVVSRLGKPSPASSLDGEPAGLGSLQLDGKLVTVPVLTSPQRIEKGVQFSLQMDGVPRGARIFLQESGLPWNQHLVLWVNDKRAGTITPEVPDLDDVGYQGDASHPYVGWRNGSIYLPVSLLKPGVNSIQFSTENEDPDAGQAADSDTANQPLALNQIIGQFDYSSEVPATTAPAAMPAVLPVAPPVADSTSGALPAPATDMINAPPLSPLPMATIP